MKTCMAVCFSLGMVLQAQAQLVWTSQVLPRDGNMRDVTYGASKFFARPVLAWQEEDPTESPRYAIASSVNGTAWAWGKAIPFRIMCSSGGNHFVGIEPWNGGIDTSTNGTTWTRLQTGTYHISKIGFSGGRYVAVASGWGALPGGIAYSSTSLNGYATWTHNIVDATTGTVNAVAYGNGIFLVVGTVRTNGVAYHQAFMSTDGRTFLKAGAFGSDSIRNVRWLNNQFVAVGSCIFTSPNGALWTVRVPRLSEDLKDVAYGKSTMVAVGAPGRILTSANNGVNWTVVPTGTWASLDSVAFGVDKFVVVGGSVVWVGK